jgi:hypothetical protein
MLQAWFMYSCVYYVGGLCATVNVCLCKVCVWTPPHPSTGRGQNPFRSWSKTHLYTTDSHLRGCSSLEKNYELVVDTQYRSQSVAWFCEPIVYLFLRPGCFPSYALIRSGMDMLHVRFIQVGWKMAGQPVGWRHISTPRLRCAAIISYQPC